MMITSTHKLYGDQANTLKKALVADGLECIFLIADTKNNNMIASYCGNALQLHEMVQSFITDLIAQDAINRARLS